MRFKLEVEKVKMLGFNRCYESKNGNEAVNNPNPRGCNVIETIGV